MKYHPDYELFEELGRGQATTVYRGHDLTLGRDVAIKELDDETHEQNPHRKAQFLQEAQFLAQFEHENILRVYSIDKQRNWIIMELMQATLASQILAAGLEPDLVRSVLRQSLRALDFLHRKQKVHAAVRPSNLLINEEGFVKLSDFEETDSDGELRVPVCGKKYLAPELFRAEFGQFGPALDFYNLGFTALELLFGPRFDSLFPGTGEGAIDSDIAWMRWHSSDEQLPAVNELDAKIPVDVASVIDRMLAKRVDQRPQTAKEVLTILEDKPLVRVEVKTPEQQQPARVPYVAAVREVGTRAAKISKGTSENSTKKSPARNTNSKKRGFAVKKLAAQAKKPLVLYPLCGALVIGVFLLSMFLPGGSQAAAKPQPVMTETKTEESPAFQVVTIFVHPPSAVVTANDEELKTAAGIVKLELEPDHDVNLVVRAVDYTELDKTIAWHELEETQFLVSVELEPIEHLPSLPDGLMAKQGSPIDADSGLPERAFSRVLGEKAPLEFVLVKPTVQRLGVDSDDKFSWESPASDYRLEHPFYIAVTETTIQQYSQFNQRQGDAAAGTSWLAPAKTWIESFNENETQSDLPATNMSQQQAESFAYWLGGRLPTENEWEAAVRYRTTASPDAEFATDEASLFRGSELEPVSVHDGAATELGLFHAIGNAAEWCRHTSPDSAIVKGCSFATPIGPHVRPTWRSTADPLGEWDIGIRVVIPVESNNE